MNRESTPMRNPGKRPAAADQAELGTYRLLILLDSSDKALSSLEFAFGLAASHRWDMHLIQLVDLDEFPEHANSLTVSRLISTECRRCANRLESFSEIIQSSGVNASVADTIMLTSRQFDSFRKRVQQIAPDLVVVGRQSFRKRLLDEIVLQSNCPVMVVPETCRKATSSSILLYSENRRRREHELFPLLRFAAIAQLRISMVTVLNKKGLGTRTYKSHLPTSTYATPVNYYQIEGRHALSAVDTFLKRNTFGMVSVILRKHWRFWRLFYRWTYIDMAYKVNVPVVVFKVK